ncbi:MAG: hypothetical protein V4813_10970 [Gemmatimonadota bacterium]
MRRVLVVEIEELLFDTLHTRASALHVALSQEGIDADFDVVHSAHRGVTAAMALDRLAAARQLDATGRELVLHRAATTASRVFDVHAPSFDTGVRDQLVALAAELPLAVVTRATVEEAQRWLAAADLEASVTAVSSLAGLDAEQQATAWHDAVRRARAEQGVAMASAALLVGARRAGLRTVQLGDAYDRDRAGYHAEAHVASLAEMNAAVLAGLFPMPHVTPHAS